MYYSEYIIWGGGGGGVARTLNISTVCICMCTHNMEESGTCRLRHAQEGGVG